MQSGLEKETNKQEQLCFILQVGRNFGEVGRCLVSEATVFWEFSCQLRDLLAASDTRIGGGILSCSNISVLDLPYFRLDLH